MEETYLLNVEGVKKKILHGGYGSLPDFKDGSKVTFHFQTLKDNFERTIIDDSRQAGIPMEIIVGKMFKIEVWETLLTSMRIGEVAEFWCDAVHTGMYALISKGMRKIAEGKDPLEGQKHRCGMGNMFDYHSTGYADLDELQRTPQPLIFIMELFKVEDPTSYKRDTWAMSNDEKLLAVPKLHTEGNRLVLSRKFKEAAEKYQEAVICLRNVQAKEKPWDEDWLKLENLITPLVLNYCQCKNKFDEICLIETNCLCSFLENVKAYFKRAKAHAAVWNEKEARADFLRVAHLDPSLAAAVRKELKILGEKMRQKHVEDRKRYQGLFKHPSQGETEERMTEASEELSGKNEVLDYGHKVEMGENNKEAFLNPKIGGQGAGTGARNQETVEAKKEEEKKGSPVKEEEKETDETFLQKETKIEIGMKKTEEQGQGKVHSYSKDDLRDGESSEIKQLGSGNCQPNKEGENAEMEGDQRGKTDFAALKGEQERTATWGISKKNVEGIATKSIAEEPMEGHCEDEMGPEIMNSTRGMENCDVMCERGEIKVWANLETQGKEDLEEENNKDGATGESSEESNEGGNSFQVHEEEPKREAAVFIELHLREEAGSDRENCGGPKKVHSIAENDERKEGTELEKTKREAGNHSEEEIRGYEADPGHCKANTEDNLIIAGDYGKQTLEDSANIRAGDSKEKRDDHGGGGKKEAKVGSSSVSQGKIQGGQGCFEAEMNFKAENLKIRMMEENAVIEQADLQVTWEGPEKIKGEMEMHLSEESFQGDDKMSPVNGEGKNKHQA
ncbi:hypothetical protein JD844_004471 [Phrynosoma platyrhinos]|uniref:AIP/AIPL N-terminal FKBP-type PPIase domain-containing protein n=1 Tax=Phrynosoma platyrhinos TaxID=52577 RepID=A0ABQ7TNC6_PHRPL|nr:hypothetical protein JD844_004471 [Phrynosoma platyrhinos]